MKTNLENAIMNKDETIQAQKEAIEARDEKLRYYESRDDPLTSHQDLVNTVSNKNEEIRLLKEKLSCNQETCNTNRLHQISNDDMFQLKPKRKKGSSQNKTCDSLECESINVDMIKCNICHKWVCEDCNNVPVSKLKLVMDKCDTIYFICKSCNGHCHFNLN